MTQLKGIIPLLKPSGFTSHDCVGKMRRLLQIKRIGHTGTLDPSVTGVLPLCIGQATRVAEYLVDRPKEYVGTMILGRATNTEDADGEIIEDRPVTTRLSEEQVEKIIKSFIGVITQTPPMFSAVKVKGVRLYELARKGQEIDRPSREIEIYELETLSMSLQQTYPEVTLRVKCSKGTYIRTLFVDIAKHLGFPAHLKSLLRTESTPFKLQDCYTFEQLEQAINEERFGQLLKPMDHALMQFPSHVVSEQQAADVLNGKKLRINLSALDGQLLRIYAPGDQFLALYRVKYEGPEEWALAEKVFN